MIWYHLLITMAKSIDQWHVAVGLFGAHRYAAIIKKRFWNIQI